MNAFTTLTTDLRLFRWLPSLVGCAIFLHLAAPVQAQTPAGDPAVDATRATAASPDRSSPPAPTPAPAQASSPDPGDGAAPQVPATAVPPAAPAASAEITSRLDDVEQTARIATRKVELAEEEAEKRAKEATAATVDEKGLTVKGPGGAYVLKIRALLQVDGRFFLNDDVLQDRDTFLVRRFRPTIEGTLFGLVDYRFVPDFAGGTAQLFDAYADIHPFAWLRLRVGKFKAPLGLERLQSDADLSFAERALDQNLSTARDIGAQLGGEIGGGVVNYALGVFNGGPDNTQADTDTNHAKDFVGRLFFQPFKLEGLDNLGNLGVGIAASIGDRKGLPQVGTTTAAPGLPAFRTFGLNTFFSYLAPASDPTGTGTVFAHLRASRINPELFYYFGPFGLLGEYVLSRQSVQKGNDTATLTHQAAHGTLSFVVNGTNGYDGATPLVPFDATKGELGALEIAVRYAWLKIDGDTFPFPAVAGAPSYADPLRNARVAQSFGGAINYVPRRSFRLAVNFEQTRFTGGAADGKVVADRKSENVLLGRAQINF